MKQLLVIIMCCLMLSGCFFAEPIPTEAPPGPPQTETPPAPTEAPIQPDTAPPVSEIPETAPPATEVPETQPPTEPETVPPTLAPTEPAPQTLTFTVYWGNDNADGFECADVEVEIMDSSAVVNKLIEHGALSEETRLNSMELDGETLHLDFNESFRDLIYTMGTSGERMMIGSVVNTFLSAYDAENIMITVNGEILESGHVVYDFPLEFFE